MNQYEMLWEFQQEDIKADRIAAELRRSAVRQKMEKCRVSSAECKKQYQGIGEQVSVMADRLEVIQHALPRCEEQLAELKRKAEENPPTDLETARQMRNEANRLRETIVGYETELRRMNKDAGDHVKRQTALRHEAATIKQQYEALKAEYEKEQAGAKERLDQQRAVVEEKKKGIDAKFLDQYAAIKKHTVPPLARLINNQCSQCNTSLPSALLRKSSTEVVECETCGRMILPI